MTESDRQARLGVVAAAGCYVFWGLTPLLTQWMARLHIGLTEMVAHRGPWILPVALVGILAAGQWPELLRVFRTRTALCWLALSGLLIGLNWLMFVWAVTHGRLIECALGQYLSPLMIMAAGALLFRERLDALAKSAIGLATAGVVILAVVMGEPPLLAIALASLFSVYVIVRKHVPVTAQVGMFVEGLVMSAPSVVYLWWLETSGQGHFRDSALTAGLLASSGLMMGLPLMIFAWAGRRAPLSTLGFVQFLSPTMSFVMGLLQGEPVGGARLISFGFIWAGVALFAWGAWRRARSLDAALRQSAA